MLASVQNRRLGERQVEADGVGGDLVAQGLELLGEPLGLLVADGRVERGDDVEEAGLAGRVGQRHHGQPGPHAREVGRLVARLELGADQGDGLPLNVTSPFRVSAMAASPRAIETEIIGDRLDELIRVAAAGAEWLAGHRSTDRRSDASSMVKSLGQFGLVLDGCGPGTIGRGPARSSSRCRGRLEHPRCRARPTISTWSSSAPATPGSRPRWPSARMGLRTALLTINCDTVGQMSCNPAIGGVAKGQIVREIDALGGAMGVLTDATAIQFRLLNRGKGPAMHSPRAQCDKKAYQFLAKLTVERQENLTLRQEMVESILVEDGRVAGVALPGRRSTTAPRAVVLTTGTFLQASMHTGEVKTPGGRGGDVAAVGTVAKPASLGFELRRFKTGTPPRLNGRTIDFTRLEPQPGDAEPVPFSFLTDSIDPAAARLPHHLHQPGGPRHHPRQPAPGADVLGPDPEHRPALLPVDRGQGRPLRRPRAAPDLPRARRAEHARILLQRHLDQPAARRAGGDHPADPRPGARRDHAIRLRGRVRLRPARRSSGRRSRPSPSPASSSPARSTARPVTRRRPPRG